MVLQKVEPDTICGVLLEMIYYDSNADLSIHCKERFLTALFTTVRPEPLILSIFRFFDFLVGNYLRCTQPSLLQVIYQDNTAHTYKSNIHYLLFRVYISKS